MLYWRLLRCRSRAVPGLGASASHWKTVSKKLMFHVLFVQETLNPKGGIDCRNQELSNAPSHSTQ